MSTPARPHRLRPTILVAALAMLVGQTGGSRADGLLGGYRLGPGDVLQISLIGQTELSGKFRVGPEGAVSYPFVGALPVTGMTTSQVVADLTARLAQHVPLRNPPTVEIVEYAPVFVTGEVEKPGQYVFRPGMVAIELVALAGGDKRPAAAFQSRALQSIAAEQAVENRRLAIFANRAQRARLLAEMEDRDFAPNLGALMAGIAVDADQARALVQNEADLFAVRKRIKLNQIASLKNQRASFEREIAALREGVRLHTGEIALVAQEADNAQRMFEKSLGVLPTVLNLKRQLSSTRRDGLEMQSYLARAQQQQLEIDQKIEDVSDQQKKDNAGALRDLDLTTAQNMKAIEAEKLAVSEMRAQLGEESAKPVGAAYRVARLVDGAYKDLAIDEFTQLAPRDILRAIRPATGSTNELMRASQEALATGSTSAKRDN